MISNPDVTRKCGYLRDLSARMHRSIPAAAMELVSDIGRIGRREGYGAFVVGGFVRDLLLGRRTFDLDIVVEGDAIRFGRVLCKKYGASIVVHKKFGTCTVFLSDKRKIDIATARRETYKRPAALPAVEFSSLRDDLMRRDFTINAMAVSIAPESFGRLVDIFGGRRDLVSGCIRALHEKSFIDDPTRIFRAVRFEQRLGFTIEDKTEGLIKEAVAEGMFGRLEPQRMRDEIVLILREADPAKALRRMEALHELQFLDPRVHFDDQMARVYGEIDKAIEWYGKASFVKEPVEKWLIYLMALLSGLSYASAKRLCGRFVFRKVESERILSYLQTRHRVGRTLAGSAPVSFSRLYRLLEPLDHEVVLLILAEWNASGDPARKRINSRIVCFFERCSGARIDISGHDLTSMGYRPSPGFNKVLAKVLYAKLDGIVHNRDEELAYAARIAPRIFAHRR